MKSWNWILEWSQSYFYTFVAVLLQRYVLFNLSHSVNIVFNRENLTLCLWAKNSHLLAVGTSRGNLVLYNHRTRRYYVQSTLYKWQVLKFNAQYSGEVLDIWLCLLPKLPIGYFNLINVFSFVLITHWHVPFYIVIGMCCILNAHFYRSFL